MSGKSSPSFPCVRCDGQAERKAVRYVTTAAGALLALFSVVTVIGLSIACTQKLHSAMFYQDPYKGERQNPTCAYHEHIGGGGGAAPCILSRGRTELSGEIHAPVAMPQGKYGATHLIWTGGQQSLFQRLEENKFLDPARKYE